MEIYTALQATWPPVVAWRLGPYTLRDGAGGGRRAEATTLDGAFADPAPAVAALRARGLRPLFMVREGQAALDAALADLGLVLYEAAVLLAAPARVVAEARPDLVVIRSEGPLAILADLWDEGANGPARRAVMARAPGPKLYLLGRLDDRPAAAAFCALHEGTAMLHALEVAPWARRRGLGARLSRDAADWACARGAETFGLAASRGNAAARALYAGIGLAEAGSYHYRIAPEGETP